MGRTAREISPDAGAELQRLAQWLRRQREDAGLGYRELSKRTRNRGGADGYSAATLSRAARGVTTPREDVVDAYAEACGADRARAAELWQRATRAAARRRMPAPPKKRQPEVVSNFKDLSAALRHIRLEAGQPSLRALKERAGPGRLPHSTLALVLDGSHAPSKELLAAFLDACRVPASMKTRWLAARQRLVDADPKLSAREIARRPEPWPVSPCDAAWDLVARRERDAELRALRSTNRYQGDYDYDAWALEYANDKAVNT